MKLELAGKSERSHGGECIVFGEIGVDGVFLSAGADASAQGLRAVGAWTLRPMSPGNGLDAVPAMVSEAAEASSYCELSDRAIVLSHGWSGVVRLRDGRRTYKVDLYCDRTRLLLLDLANELIVEVTALAAIENGGLRLPPLTLPRLIDHIAESWPWFAFAEPEPASNAFAAWRDRSRRAARERARVRLLSSLLPRLSGLRAVAPPSAGATTPSSPPQDVRALQDQLRLLAAALDGAASRSA